MIYIPGFKTIKNKKGKITHVRLSLKHHSKILEDIILHAEMVKARKGKFVEWETAKKELNKKFDLKK